MYYLDDSFGFVMIYFADNIFSLSPFTVPMMTIQCNVIVGIFKLVHSVEPLLFDPINCKLYLLVFCLNANIFLGIKDQKRHVFFHKDQRRWISIKSKENLNLFQESIKIIYQGLKLPLRGLDLLQTQHKTRGNWFYLKFIEVQ